MSSSIKPHVLVIPFPLQGHIMPLMELSHRLADRDFPVTFGNTEHIHERLMAAARHRRPSSDDFAGKVKMVAIPDGWPSGDDRNKFGTFCHVMLKEMAGHLENLILDINRRDDWKITCVIADAHMPWALQVAEKLSIRRVVFWPASAATFSVMASISPAFGKTSHRFERLRLGIEPGPDKPAGRPPPSPSLNSPFGPSPILSPSPFPFPFPFPIPVSLPLPPFGLPPPFQSPFPILVSLPLPLPPFPSAFPIPLPISLRLPQTTKGKHKMEEDHGFEEGFCDCHGLCHYISVVATTIINYITINNTTATSIITITFIDDIDIIPRA
ncbi:hypothetical protein EJ110_NYTH17564 [Nymphaea thermarum]|nr:hypothetical protein EJ110_NYTH17564 [Nymphaea thermarum]